MYGSILGDIAGSRLEFSKPQGFNAKTAKLFTNNCFFTDDTVMTIATKYAVLNSTTYASAYASFGMKYPYVGYGTMFKNWINSHPKQAYNSFGNGAAMRVSFIGEYFDSIEKVKTEAEKSALCTHNHEEGVKGAVATAVCVYLSKSGCSKKEIRRYIERNYGYNFHRTLKMMRPFSKFDITCQGTLPVAFRCFWESDSWEECIRNVFSITCDTDTVGCIAGGIADAFYHGTGFDEKQLLQKYLIKSNAQGVEDTYLFDWATKE